MEVLDALNVLLTEMEALKRRVAALEKRPTGPPRFGPLPSIYPPGPGPGMSPHEAEQVDYKHIMSELQELRKRLVDDDLEPVKIAAPGPAPFFKVGDRIRLKKSPKKEYTIIDIGDIHESTCSGYGITFECGVILEEHYGEWELVPASTILQPGDPCAGCISVGCCALCTRYRYKRNDYYKKDEGEQQ